MRQYQILSEQEPLIIEFKNGYARASLGLGSVYHVLGDLEKFLEARMRAADIRADLSRQNPNASQLKSSYANALNGVGAGLRDLGRAKESLDYHARAFEQHVAAVNVDPRQPILRMRLVSGLVQCARAHSKVGDFKSAAESLDKIREFAAPTDSRAFFIQARELVIIACRLQDAIEKPKEDEAELPEEISQEELIEKAKACIADAKKMGFDVDVWSGRDADFKIYSKYKHGEEFLAWIKQTYPSDSPK